ncbi:MAG: hypothetical protein LBU16_03035 [Treponema sp.]|nr:hypothetical protein [Treponema sp.]
MGLWNRLSPCHFPSHRLHEGFGDIRSAGDPVQPLRAGSRGHAAPSLCESRL